MSVAGSQLVRPWEVWVLVDGLEDGYAGLTETIYGPNDERAVLQLARQAYPGQAVHSVRRLPTRYDGGDC